MKILHITETSEGASGVATFVRELCRSLAARGVESRVLTQDDFARDGFAPVAQAAWDIVHIHGLWLPFYHQAASWARLRGIPVVWSTHGMTAPWSMRHKRWKKRLAWGLYQKRDLLRAAAIHCTTELEAGWNRDRGLKKDFVVPLGTEIKPRNTQNTRKNGERVLLFVGRIYPVKGLVNLIRAWQLAVSSQKIAVSGERGAVSSQQIAVSGERWILRIVGPDEAGHQAELEKLVAELALEESVAFTGPKFKEDLEREYEACDCLVLPSFTENFGATVVDALAHGKPCIASTFTPWEELQTRGCGWWTGNEPPVLAQAIRDMMDMDDDGRCEMGVRGRRLVEEKYIWAAVAEAMVREYERICHDGRTC